MGARFPVVLVPAHLNSQRLPRKALALIGDVPMVVHCAQQAIAAGLPTYVCSDSVDILESCQCWGIPSIETPMFTNGTDRCAWAAKSLDSELFVLLQGDEPLISPGEIKRFSDTLVASDDKTSFILNGLSLLSGNRANDPNNVKASVNANGDLIFLSRHPILSELEWISSHTCQDQSDLKYSGTGHLKQLGLYGLSSSSLIRFSETTQSQLEKAERVEMLRWIVSGHPLRGVILDTPAISVDTASDLSEANLWLNSCE